MALVRQHAHERPVLVIPTGGGKTSIAADIIRRATERGRRSVFLVHRRELVDQAVERLAQFGVDAGRILAGHREKRSRAVQVASIPTLVRREHWPADVVIVDECQHAVSDSWRSVLGRYGPEKPDATWRQSDASAPACIIGLTATPCRLDGKPLGDVFGKIIEPVSTRELIERGYLVAPTVFAPPVDLSGLKVVAGDYAIDELAVRMGKLVGSLTRTWIERARGLRTVAFAVNIEHSLAIVDAFRALGVRADHVDFKTPAGERAKILRDLKAGTIEFVSQVQLLTEGWDLPALQCVILARPTKSLALFRQMVGRVLRPPGPVFVLDHAGNHNEHGPVDEPIEWSLTGKPKRKGAAPVKTCPECFALVPIATVKCPECGHTFDESATAERPGVAVENPGELVVYRAPTRDEKADFYRSAVLTASERAYKLGWARKKYFDKFNAWPRLGEIERELYVCAGHEWEPKTYGWKDVERCTRCFFTRPRVPAL